MKKTIISTLLTSSLLALGGAQASDWSLFNININANQTKEASPSRYHTSVTSQLAVTEIELRVSEFNFDKAPVTLAQDRFRVYAGRATQMPTTDGRTFIAQLVFDKEGATYLNISDDAERLGKFNNLINRNNPLPVGSLVNINNVGMRNKLIASALIVANHSTHPKELTTQVFHTQAAREINNRVYSRYPLHPGTQNQVSRQEWINLSLDERKAYIVLQKSANDNQGVFDPVLEQLHRDTLEIERLESRRRVMHP